MNWRAAKFVSRTHITFSREEQSNCITTTLASAGAVLSFVYDIDGPPSLMTVVTLLHNGCFAIGSGPGNIFRSASRFNIWPSLHPRD